MARSKTQPLNPKILEFVIHGLEIQRNKLEQQIAQLRAVLGRPTTPRPGSERLQRSRPVLSAAARKRIATAQKKRWAVIKAKQQGGNKSRRKVGTKKTKA